MTRTAPPAGLPRATLRLQFHAGYTLDDAAVQAPYFAALGVSHIYASPLLAARAGSMHGYDGIDPTAINPELGGEAALRRLVGALRENRLGLIVDIVPNHLAASTQNPWWVDVLTWGARSAHADWFDIDWRPADPALHGKVLLPALGRPYGQALAAGELSVALDAAAGRFELAYFEHRFPLSPATHAALLERLSGRATTARAEPAEARAARRFAEADALGGRDGASAFQAACAALAEAFAGGAVWARAIDDGLAGLNADHAALHAVLERQHYRLAWWRTASDEINWRRFFDVHELVGMNAEHEEVFDAMHATLLRLVGEGLIDGLRVDHVDGLTDPGDYCGRLRRAAMRRWPHDPSERPFYLVVEKILCGGETLRTDWAVDGSTGYDFMNDVGAWLHHPGGEAPLGRLWERLSGRSAGFEPEALAARRELIGRSFSAQLESTVDALHAVARGRLESRDTSAASIRRALTELLVHFPVYRTYAWDAGRDDVDEAAMRQALAGARRSLRRADLPVLEALARWLGGGPFESEGRDIDLRRVAVRRFQQLTAPLAAKAVEDTAFYRHGRLLSRNDVGFEPRDFSIGNGEFHRRCAARRRLFPQAMLATATHDHKRGEDVRARLAVLSECPREWGEAVLAWQAMNQGLRVATGSGPSPGDEAMLYQVLLGAWPTGLRADDADGLSAFRDRLWRWQEKALREAKLATDWIAPDEGHEAGCKAFLGALLDPARSAGFLAGFHGWVARVEAHGMRNGLLQTLLKYTLPGVPDLYQGCELWDLSLVDPDNRRPVDFRERAALLERCGDSSLADLAVVWRDGAVKQALIHRLLACRAAAPRLFAEGDYRPWPIDGGDGEDGRLIAFERRLGVQRLLVVAARWPLVLEQAAPGECWGGAELASPDGSRRGAWRDVLAPGQLRSPAPPEGDLPALRRLLRPALPFAVRAVL